MKSNRIKTQLNYIKNLPSKKTDALTLLVVFLFFLEIGLVFSVLRLKYKIEKNPTFIYSFDLNLKLGFCPLLKDPHVLRKSFQGFQSHLLNSSLSIL